MALIRPIITYGCPIWFNDYGENKSVGEKVPTSMFKPIQISQTNYYFYYSSNKKIYNKAKVPRIDNFILKLIRNHFASTKSVLTNGLIQGLTYPNPLYFVKTLASGHIPPEAFLYLDEKGFIQNNENIIIYYGIRWAGNTKITFPSNLDMTINSDLCRYSTALPKRDIKDKHRRNIERYWWLDTWVQCCAICKFVNDLFTFFVYFILLLSLLLFFLYFLLIRIKIVYDFRIREQIFYEAVFLASCFTSN